MIPMITFHQLIDTQKCNSHRYKIHNGYGYFSLTINIWKSELAPKTVLPDHNLCLPSGRIVSFFMHKKYQMNAAKNGERERIQRNVCLALRRLLRLHDAHTVPTILLYPHNVILFLPCLLCHYDVYSVPTVSII